MQRIYINTLEPQGQEFVIDDPAIWADPIAEFGMDCRVLQPITAKVLVLPTEKGCLVRGTLTGEVALPCNRCTEEARTVLNSSFETFEFLPGYEPEEDEGDEAIINEAPLEDSHIVLEDSIPVLDMAALCWEEFSLALPIKPLCKAGCKGLCPNCGINLNTGTCACTQEEGDPRLSILRSLTIKK